MRTALWADRFEPLTLTGLKLLEGLKSSYDRVVLFPYDKRGVASSEARLSLLRLSLDDRAEIFQGGRPEDFLEDHADEDIDLCYQADKDVYELDSHPLHRASHHGWDSRVCLPLELASLDIGRATRQGEVMDISLPVFRTIVENGLYFAKYIRSYLTKARYDHSCQVAYTAYKIALRNGIDPQQALLGGIYHDVGKDLEEKKQREVVKEQFGLDVKEGYALHQYVSAYLARTVFNVADRPVLDAIMSHCTGRGVMTPLDMLIYSADKCEPTRPFETLSHRKACLDNLQEGFILILRDQVSYFKSHNIAFMTNPDTIEMYHTYLGEPL